MDPTTVTPGLHSVAVTAALLGLFSHWAWFIHGDHLIWAQTYLALITLGPFVATAVFVVAFGIPMGVAATISCVATSSYLTALYASMGVYRGFLHPLRFFPGPPRARFTQFWHVAKIWKKNDNHMLMTRLHQQYGDYVRVSSNLLSIADPDWVYPIHEAGSQWAKDEWYDAGYPLTTLHQMRSKPMHDARRRHGWDKAFTTKSLRSYDSRQLRYADQLVAQVRARSGESLNATEWLHFFAFDVMGDLAFGRSFSALEKGEAHFFMDILQEASVFAGKMFSATWVLQLFGLIPMSWSPMGKLLIYSQECVDERRSREPEEPDVMSHILAAGDFFKGQPQRERLLLMGDARLLIVAGSDTTASTLVHCFYHFARDPSLVAKIREELKTHGIQKGKAIEVQALQYLDYMNAVINETLRLHPPVPGGVYRQTPRGGVTINGVRLPGGVRIIGPHYVIQRSPKAFRQPLDFIPERWTTRPELILNRLAFFPFLVGRFGCIGKQLALSEVRTVITKMVLEFDVRFADGEDGRALLEESMDTFTTFCAPLNLVWTERDAS